MARNISLDHVPEDVDICVCTDLDELFEPGWRKKLEEAWLNQGPGSSRQTAGMEDTFITGVLRKTVLLTFNFITLRCIAGKASAGNALFTNLSNIRAICPLKPYTSKE